MGFLQRLRERIDPPRDADPNEQVVIAVVPFAEGPLVQSAIEAAGIPAVLQETRPLPNHGWVQQRIVVRQHDVEAAEAVLAELRGR